MNLSRRHWLARGAAPLATALLLPACAALTDQSGPQVDLAGIDSLPGEGLELRFVLKLRVQNPSERELRFEGAWAEISLRDLPLASGGAPVAGVVPRFSEAVIALPVTASGLRLAQQAISLWQDSRDGRLAGPVRYALRGRLGGSGWAVANFERRGEIDLGPARRAPRSAPDNGPSQRS